jgi:hypothetical protein
MSSEMLRFVFDATGDDLDAARECEADVFLSTYGNTKTEFEYEYARYESDTRFMAILDSDGVALAACRLILPGRSGLKTVTDLRRQPWGIDGERSAAAAGIDLGRACDIATIAVRKQRGAGLCSAALYHGIVAGCRANGLDWVVMIMDERARRLLSAAGITTFAFPGAEPGPYLGSTVSTPLFGDLTTMFDTQRRANREAYRMIFQGIGLDGIAMPSPDEWVLRGLAATPQPSGASL